MSEAQLYDLYKERQKASNNWIEPGPFVVLDERSVDRKTVTILDELLKFDDNDVETGTERHKWRVAFSDATQMIAQLLYSPQIVDDVYKRADRYVDADGVFPVAEAERQEGYRTDQPTGLPPGLQIEHT